MKAEIQTEFYVTLRQLAELLRPDEPQKEYNAIKQRLRRNIYSQIKKEGKQTLININDAAIPAVACSRFLVRNNRIELAKDAESNPGEIPENYMKIALARVDLIKQYELHTNREHNSILNAKHNFIKLYNQRIFPEIYETLGEITFKTIERWKKTYADANKDYRALVPVYKRQKNTSITPGQADTIIKLFLNPNRPLISEVARNAREIFIIKDIHPVLSESTYRRFIERWQRDNYATAVFYREGEKALNDKCLPYIERDFSVIEVGDIIVADGHTLNFEIINPFTGRPKRFALILFKDMKSNYPLGWELNLTENVQSISTALYRSVLRLGKYPKVIYLDNGRAFAAKFFQGVNLEQVGFTGIFEKIGAKVIYAWPYHGQSKTIERFFGSFAELERMMPSYTGTSIELQPPRMNRGEKLHNKLYERAMSGVTIDVMTAHRAIAYWFDKYAERQQKGHLNGKSPKEIFEKGKGSGVNKQELVFLMMKEEVKTLYRNGIRLFNEWYWNDNLFGLRRDSLLIRYDMLDNDTIYVFEPDGSFLCNAARMDKVHPAASILGSDEDVRKLNEAIAKKQELKKYITGSARQFLEEEIYETHKKQLNAANIINLAPDPEENTANSNRKKKSLIDRWQNPLNKKAAEN